MTVYNGYYGAPNIALGRWRDLQWSTNEVAAGTEPVDLATAKNHLRVEHTGDDAEITRLISAARSSCERLAHRTIRAVVGSEMTLDEFPTSGQLPIPLPPLLDVAALKYVDDSNVEQTLSADQYGFTTSTRGAGYIYMSDTFERPVTANRRNAIKIEYTSGYATVDDVPQDLISAILIQIDLLWDQDALPQVLQRYEQSRDSLLGNWDPGTYAE